MISDGRDFFVSGEQTKTISAGPSFVVYINNTSSQPIYDVVIRTDHGDDDHLPRLMPSAFAVFYKSPEATWAVSDFRDTGFALWSRGGSGRLLGRGDQGAVTTEEVFEGPDRAS